MDPNATSGGNSAKALHDLCNKEMTGATDTIAFCSPIESNLFLDSLGVKGDEVAMQIAKATAWKTLDEPNRIQA